MVKTFNKEQIEAIQHDKGPALILAGPGSGKTTVITERIRYLIQSRHVQPQKILVITFTKAAATEMKLRFRSLMGGKTYPVQFGTFHAIFFTILRHAYHYNVNNIIKDDVRQQLLRELVNRMTTLQIEDEPDLLMELAGEISHVKSERIVLEHYYAKCCGHEDFREIYMQYEKELQQRRLLDFDDMLVYCYELFVQRKDILQQWQQQYSYILIDEFQDINRVQYDIIRMLAQPEDNLFIVGDDDQSIYRFRGANPEIMLHFPKDYKEAKRVTLATNYRCPKQVVELAGRVISNNQNRFAKQIQAAESENAPDGKELPKDTVTIRCYDTIFAQNDSIASQIQQYHKEGISYRSMTALFRTNTQAHALAAKLMEYNIPFTMKEAVPNLYHHWIARNVIAYLKIAAGSRERSLFLQIINRPLRYISREALSDKQVDFEELFDYYEDKEWMAERIEQLQYDLAVMSDMRPYAAINYLRKGVGYDAFLQQYAREHKLKADELMEILDEIHEQAKASADTAKWLQYIKDYTEQLKEQKQTQKNEEEEERVILGTMHGAKGLEYDVVFIPDANEGTVPHSKAVLEADMEEERRMFYVAMTRAKNHLHISYVKNRYNKEVDASRFIEELIREP